MKQLELIVAAREVCLETCREWLKNNEDHHEWFAGIVQKMIDCDSEDHKSELINLTGMFASLGLAVAIGLSDQE